MEFLTDAVDELHPNITSGTGDPRRLVQLWSKLTLELD